METPMTHLGQHSHSMKTSTFCNTCNHPPSAWWLIDWTDLELVLLQVKKWCKTKVHYVRQSSSPLASTPANQPGARTRNSSSNHAGCHAMIGCYVSCLPLCPKPKKHTVIYKPDYTKRIFNRTKSNPCSSTTGKWRPKILFCKFNSAASSMILESF